MIYRLVHVARLAKESVTALRQSVLIALCTMQNATMQPVRNFQTHFPLVLGTFRAQISLFRPRKCLETFKSSQITHKMEITDSECCSTENKRTREKVLL